MKSEHFCTYFDSGFLPQGLALWRSLQAHDPAAVLWVLALDETAGTVLRELGEPGLRVVPLGEVEAGDPALAVAKANRSRVEYYFTLSPCWPRWLLQTQPEIARLTYLDADLFFFGPPQAIFDELGAGSVLVCAHDFPSYLRRYEHHGRFNVGVLVWRRDPAGLACLDWWRERCLDWCHDRLEPERYADQKYLEQWPTRFPGVIECRNPGVNLAPWNWMHRACGIGPGRQVLVGGRTLIVFHFARFRGLGGGERWWQSGHLDYGVMPAALRNALYGAYWRALNDATAEVRTRLPGWVPMRQALRLDRAFWRGFLLRAVFGSDWLRVGDRFVSGRFGLGRYSGRILAALRTIFFRR